MSDKSIYQELCEIGDFAEAMPMRATYLQEKIKAFLKKINTSSIVINENAIAHLLLDYFADISRLKLFHNITDISDEKMLAYTVYWLCRRKPIQCASTRIDDKYVFVNEAFATTLIRDGLGEMVDGKLIPDKLLRHIYYHLRYRLVDAQSIELVITAFIEGYAINKRF
ncbi:MAG: hypothetical protein FWF81_11755 [Defluviitaleaceae bacterium]|nr:hypothetical protein [Defluviitaleaceae bacterium]